MTPGENIRYIILSLFGAGAGGHGVHTGARAVPGEGMTAWRLRGIVTSTRTSVRNGLKDATQSGVFVLNINQRDISVKIENTMENHATNAQFAKDFRHF